MTARDTGDSGATPKPAGGRTPATAKEIVNRLDQREVRFGYGGAGLALLLTIYGFVVDDRSHVAKTHSFALSLLVAGLIGTLLLFLGTVLKRRPLLGFAAFLAGLEMLSFGDVVGVLYLFFGGWLIMRVMRKQRLDREAGVATGSGRLLGGRSRPQKPAGPVVPQASSRYTPPKGARTRAGRAASSRKR